MLLFVQTQPAGPAKPRKMKAEKKDSSLKLTGYMESLQVKVDAVFRCQFRENCDLCKNLTRAHHLTVS